MRSAENLADAPASSFGHADTIAAIATPPGRGGIGIVRVAGGRAADVSRALTGRLSPARRATRAEFRDAQGTLIDSGLALFFPAPYSYTGEPVLELHGHGGMVVMQLLLTACLDAGARLAEPGEFTRRAFLNGKLDLAQSEAVADLIESASNDAARCALRSLSGEFSSAVRGLVAKLTELRALTEAMLDFPEDEVDSLHRDDALRGLNRVRVALDEILARSRQGSLLREGIRVVIAGRPNVGKSSLLNRLAGAERAIVTPIAGTTRDALREDIQIEGVPLRVVDTAGLREAVDEIERIGVERAWQELGRADVVLAVFDAAEGVQAADRTILERFENELPAGAVRIDLFNKIDIAGIPARSIETTPQQVYLSAKTGDGLELLRHALLAAAGWQRSGETLFLARARHLRALESAQHNLAVAGDALPRWELFAEELRLAQESLNQITGEFTSDDLLGEIFSRFCIGK
ncbi:MAG: tRNA uridine-5-carboxymethylaminomethyl(34) synthesis GTPase MnmE [Betaproteobacteria bacterium]|nr:tRNA uridine-5-carboxymethylaminomethyl(34) synthesis GTPase MnmE [Betaproteobacteria bacterium]